MSRTTIVSILCLVIAVVLITYGFNVSLSLGFTYIAIFVGSVIVNLLVQSFIDGGRK